MATQDMRLRLVVCRSSLPDANVVWNVSLANNPTIARLLEQVSDIFPLESGEWGLEDYAVELRDSSGSSFECLHFQPIRNVLKEDDQVFIRPLFTDDLRRRRISGRHQISTDGKHLIDGIAFGRPLLRTPRGRPMLEIPPRKRRRIAFDVDEEEAHEEEEEEDFNPEDDEEMLMLTNGEDESENADRPRTVRVMAPFEDIDADADGEAEDEIGDFWADQNLSRASGSESDSSDASAHDGDKDEDLEEELRDLQNDNAPTGETDGVAMTSRPKIFKLSNVVDASGKFTCAKCTKTYLDTKHLDRHARKCQGSGEPDAAQGKESKVDALQAAFPAAPSVACDKVIETAQGDLKKAYLTLAEAFSPQMSESALLKKWSQKASSSSSSTSKMTRDRPSTENKAKALQAAFPDAPYCASVLSQCMGDLGKAYLRLRDTAEYQPRKSDFATTKLAQELQDGAVLETESPAQGQSTSKRKAAEKPVNDVYEDEEGSEDDELEGVSDFVKQYDQRGLPPGTISSGKGLKAIAQVTGSFSSSKESQGTLTTLGNGTSSFEVLNEDDDDDDDTSDSETSSTSSEEESGKDGSSEDDEDESSDSDEDGDGTARQPGQHETSDSNSSSDDSSDDSDSGPEERSTKNGAPVRSRGSNPKVVRDSSDVGSSDGSSSSEESDSEDSSSSDDSSEDESSDAESSSARRSEEVAAAKTASRTIPDQNTLSQSEDNAHSQSQSAFRSSSQPPVPPGAGKEATKKRNARRKAALKAKRQADQAEASAYAEDISSLGTPVAASTQQAEKDFKKQSEKEAFEAKRQALLDALANGGVEVGPGSPALEDQAATSQQSNKRKRHEPVSSTTIHETPDGSPATEQADVADSQKRRRVDLGAGRRMLFGALGLSNPKSKEDENTLRTKLMKGVRPHTNSRLEPETTEVEQNTAVKPSDRDVEAEEDPDAWRDKITYRAVECCQEGVHLSEPPFPFVQRWDPQQQGAWFHQNKKNKRGGGSKKRDRNQAHFYQDQVGKKRKFDESVHYEEGEYDESGYDNIFSGVGDHTNGDIELNYDDIDAASEDKGNESTEITQLTDLEDLPSVPKDLTSLPPLRPGEVQNGMVITWKQLVLSKSTNWQPQVSDLTGVVVKIDDDATGLQVLLARRDRNLDRNEESFDDDGQRVYDKFEAPELGDEGEEDELERRGYRALSFADMQDPRIIQQPLPVEEPAVEEGEKIQSIETDLIQGQEEGQEQKQGSEASQGHAEVADGDITSVVEGEANGQAESVDRCSPAQDKNEAEGKTGEVNGVIDGQTDGISGDIIVHGEGKVERLNASDVRERKVSPLVPTSVITEEFDNTFSASTVPHITLDSKDENAHVGNMQAPEKKATTAGCEQVAESFVEQSGEYNPRESPASSRRNQRTQVRHANLSAESSQINSPSRQLHEESMDFSIVAAADNQHRESLSANDTSAAAWGLEHSSIESEALSGEGGNRARSAPLTDGFNVTKQHDNEGDDHDTVPNSGPVETSQPSGAGPDSFEFITTVAEDHAHEHDAIRRDEFPPVTMTDEDHSASGDAQKREASVPEYDSFDVTSADDSQIPELPVSSQRVDENELVSDPAPVASNSDAVQNRPDNRASVPISDFDAVVGDSNPDPSLITRTPGTKYTQLNVSSSSYSRCSPSVRSGRQPDFSSLDAGVDAGEPDSLEPIEDGSVRHEEDSQLDFNNGQGYRKESALLGELLASDQDDDQERPTPTPARITIANFQKVGCNQEPFKDDTNDESDDLPASSSSSLPSLNTLWCTAKSQKTSQSQSHSQPLWSTQNSRKQDGKENDREYEAYVQKLEDLDEDEQKYKRQSSIIPDSYEPRPQHGQESLGGFKRPSWLKFAAESIDAKLEKYSQHKEGGMDNPENFEHRQKEAPSSINRSGAQPLANKWDEDDVFGDDGYKSESDYSGLPSRDIKMFRNLKQQRRDVERELLDGQRVLTSLAAARISPPYLSRTSTRTSNASEPRAPDPEHAPAVKKRTSPQIPRPRTRQSSQFTVPPDTQIIELSSDSSSPPVSSPKKKSAPLRRSPRFSKKTDFVRASQNVSPTPRKRFKKFTVDSNFSRAPGADSPEKYMENYVDSEIDDTYSPGKTSESSESRFKGSGCSQDNRQTRSTTTPLGFNPPRNSQYGSPRKIVGRLSSTKPPRRAEEDTSQATLASHVHASLAKSMNPEKSMGVATRGLGQTSAVSSIRRGHLFRRGNSTGR